MRSGWHNPGYALPALAGTLIPLVLALFAPTIPEQGVTPVSAAQGRLLLPRQGRLAVLDLASHSESLLHPTREPVLGVAWSPDGTRIAFAQWGKQPDDRFGSSSLYLLKAGQAVLAIVRGGSPGCDPVLRTPGLTASPGIPGW